jgi:hypothetical protein
MSFDPHSRRFDWNWQFPALETDVTKTSRAPIVSPFSQDEELTHDPVGWEFDEALEQLVSEKCARCPLCGAAVGRDGASMS